MIAVEIRWKKGAPETFEAGQFLVYEDGDYELVGSHTALTDTRRIVKHTTLVEGHELEWLQSMATKRHLGDSK